MVAALFRSVLAAGLILALVERVDAQQLPLNVPFEIPGTVYSEAIPEPEQILGHTIGTSHSRPHQIVDYFKAVAQSSDRVTFHEYGRTHENRPLVYAVVASQENQARIEEIRTRNLEVARDPAAFSDRDLSEMPLIAELHFSVHGNEASGSEAAMLVLYHLAAGSGAPVASILDSVVVVIDPIVNPDGRDRFVDWVNGSRGRIATSDPADREHNEPWPGGRTNHYWFDLNRDWLPVQQPESEARIELFHSWKPQVLLDVHEMGSDESFFFQPGVPSRANPWTPPEAFELTAELTQGSARALDAIGSLYFSGETFDDFYYGKGSTYPDINGSIGILFEQGSSRGLERETRDGMLSYGFSIRNQVAATLGLLDQSARSRTRVLRYQRDFYDESAEEASEAGFDGWLIGSAKDRSRTDELVRLLLKHRVEVRPLKAETTVDAKTFVARDSYVIPVEQEQFRLVRALMDTVTVFRDSVFYDVSTWTLPLAFGVQSARYNGNLAHISVDPIQDAEPRPGNLVGGRSDYAYVMPWGDLRAPRALHQLLASGVPARVALEPFETVSAGESVYFDRGAIIAPVRPRDVTASTGPTAIHDLVSRLAGEHGVDFYAVETGLTSAGIDLGSPRSVPLHPTSTGLLVGKPLTAYRAGEVWHLLSYRTGIPVSLVEFDGLAQRSLDRYDVLILVDGDFEEVRPEFGDKLRAWVESGGYLIASERGAEWLASVGVSTAEFLEADIPDEVPWVKYGDREAVKQARQVSGAILEVDLDPSHPIAFGLGKRVALFRMRNSVLKPSVEPGTTVGVYRPDPLLSGYLPSDFKSRVPASAAITSQVLGEGRIILIQDVLPFRAFWYGSDALLLNAILFREAY